MSSARSPDPTDEVSDADRRSVRWAGASPRDRRADPVHQGVHGVPGPRPARASPACSCRVTPPRSSPSQATGGSAGGAGRCTWTSRRGPGRSRSPSRTRCRRRASCGTDLSAEAVELAREEREAARPARRVRHRRSVRGLPRTLRGHGGRRHPAPAVRADARARRPARGDPRVGAGAHADGPQPRRARPHRRGRLGRRPRGSRANGWLLIEVSPDRVTHVEGRLRPGRLPRHAEHEGRPAAVDAG